MSTNNHEKTGPFIDGDGFEEEGRVEGQEKAIFGLFFSEVGVEICLIAGWNF